MINYAFKSVICVIIMFSIESCMVQELKSQNNADYIMLTWKNNSFYGFRGIRYAEPPTEQLRFQVGINIAVRSFLLTVITFVLKAPVPHLPNWNVSDPWQLRTTKDASPCPSPYTSVHNEDCLHLNVYTRNINNRLPVIVFIHPGGFYIGSGNAEYYGPAYLLEQSVVLVTFNYRLGFLGFASTGDIRAPGNAGLKDQALVLRWVHQNIAQFGGNADRVTIVGASAGALSVALHLVSPISVGLFHRAVVMSGSVLPQTKLPRNQTDLIRRQATLLNCTSSDWFDCLIATNASDLAGNVYNMFEFVRDNPIFVWLPVVEEAGSDGAFLTIDNPLQAIERGAFEKVPLMVGTTENELASSAFELLTSSKDLKEWKNNFKRWGPICLLYERNTERADAISLDIWNYYFGSECCSFEITNNV